MKTIYLVLQTQDSVYYENYPIYALDNEDKAKEYARRLNKVYSKGCKVSKDYDFIEATSEWDRHYYTVMPLVLNEKLAPFYS